MRWGMILKKLLEAVKDYKIVLFALSLVIINQYVIQVLINKLVPTDSYAALVICFLGPNLIIIIFLIRCTRSILKKSEEKISYLANYDQLTDLPNRVLFIDKTRQALSQAELTGSKVGVLFIDINRFKIINNTFSHNTGDQLLTAVSNRIMNCIREVDTFSRISGDLFSILISNIQDESELNSIFQGILSKFAEPFKLERHEIFISLSLGIAIFPHDGLDVETLMKNADTALNRAKEKGTNNYEFYRKDMNDNALEKVVFETDLRRAMEKEEFFLVFQPQLELKEGSITGVEALLRWKHDLLGIISPAQFIPLAEETGLIVPIGRWVLNEACKQLKRWHNIGFDKLTVAVNVSAKQFEQSDIVDTVYSVLQQNNLDPKYLQLELTENIVMKNRDKFLHTFHEFRKLGINVAIDDFGTGFSSLSYLKKFDVNQLKIDKSFVKEICMDYRDEAITAAIISMAHSLNLDVLAEGVETEEQLLVLKNQSCDKIQGYYFSRPEKAEEIEKMLREDRRL